MCLNLGLRGLNMNPVRARLRVLFNHYLSCRRSRCLTDLDLRWRVGHLLHLPLRFVYLFSTGLCCQFVCISYIQRNGALSLRRGSRRLLSWRHLNQRWHSIAIDLPRDAHVDNRLLFLVYPLHIYCRIAWCRWNVNWCALWLLKHICVCSRR